MLNATATSWNALRFDSGMERQVQEQVSTLQKANRLVADISECKNATELKAFDERLEEFNDSALWQTYDEKCDDLNVEKCGAPRVAFEGNESVNGYQLYQCTPSTLLFTPFEYAKICKLWNGAETLHSLEQFISQFDIVACSEWGKVDDYGEYFRGEFWEAKEEYALSQTMRKNAAVLFALPYPKNAILYIVEIMCTSFNDHSVRYCNFLCEFIKRAIDAEKH